ncbi:hypothetical protein M116_3856 [Bacteroides fragilis str. 3719 A10]|uniref:Uncharacterized protein n=1 Tax=Bacteroides fragilis str. 2-F-2 \|nr:hypothetical protein M077_4006 [Bacteroides fragilis str. 2-F-2 \
MTYWKTRNFLPHFFVLQGIVRIFAPVTKRKENSYGKTNQGNSDTFRQ